VPLSLRLQLYRPEADISRIFLPGNGHSAWMGSVQDAFELDEAVPGDIGGNYSTCRATEMIFVMLRRKLVTLR
jgi:hypothetical protein